MRCCWHVRLSEFIWMSVSICILGMFTPRMVIGDNEHSINILVPLKLGFHEFVTWQSPMITPTNATLTFSGFSIEVFERCVEIINLNYTLNYTLIGYGDGISDPNYDQLLQALIDSKVC